jgi:DNA repair protein SbcC/Rad50
LAKRPKLNRKALIMLGFLKKLFLPDEMTTRSVPTAKPGAKAVAKPVKSAPASAPLSQTDALAAIKSPDASARKAALQHVSDLTVLADRAQNDADSTVKQMAQGKLKAALIDAKRPLPERTRALNVLDAAVLEYVAKSADAPLRKAALEKITRVGFLGDRAISDPDSAIRLSLVQRIEAPNTLERIAEAARTKDKAVYRAASEKLAAAKFAAGDQGEIDSRALLQCNNIDAVLRDPPSDVEARLAEFSRAWDALAGKASPTLTTRFVGARATLERIVHPPVVVATSAVDAFDAADAPDATEAGAVVLRAGLDLELADAIRRVGETLVGETLARTPLTLAALDSAQAIVDARFAAISPSAEDAQALAAMRPLVSDARTRLRAELAQQQAKYDAQSEQLRGQIKQFAAAVDAGDLVQARASEKALDAQKTAIATLLQPADKRTLGDARAKLGKLLAWERWSANKHRIELCDAAIALAGSGLHPDALQGKVTELKVRWAELDRLDGLDADAAKALGIGKRFRALCFEAIKPAQGYFDKRKELRAEKREETQTLVTRAEALLVEGVVATPKELLDARGELAERMRNLDLLDPKARAVLSKNIREVNDALSAKLNDQRKAAETDKRRVIARLRRDLIGAEPGAAIMAAKTAQAEWKNLARADRKVEDELWAELRGLVDPHFASAKEASEKLIAADAEKEAAGNDIIVRTRALVAQAHAEQSVHTELEKLENEWRAYMQADVVEEKPNARSRDGDMGGYGREDRSKERKDRDPRELAKRERERAKDKAFDAAVADVQRARLAVEASQQQAMRSLAAQKSALCLDVESAWLNAVSLDLDAVRERWSALPSLPTAKEQPLAQRFATACSALTDATPVNADTLANNAKIGAELALALEYLSARESPTALKTERMQYQVQRLSTKLSQGAGESAADEIARLTSDWLALGPLSASDRAELTRRVLP